MVILRIVAVGLCGALFAGYCVHFDRKRRSDPNFKMRLRESRRKQAAKEVAELSKIPDLSDATAVQNFYLEELQRGEELLTQGDYEKGVDHVANAIAVYPQPQLLKVLEQALPPFVFQRLLNKLTDVSQHITDAQSRKQEVALAVALAAAAAAAAACGEMAELSKPLDLKDAMAMQRFLHEKSACVSGRLREGS